MAKLDEILIELAKGLNKLSNFMEKQGAGLTKSQAHEVATILKGNADSLINLAKKV